MADPRSDIDRSGEMALVVTTLPDAGSAERLVNRLLQEKRIACGNLIPGIVSLYWWKGEIAKEGEVLVVLKTESSSMEKLFERVAELHPYAVPELVELPVAGVARAYSRWVMESTRIGA
ncbi:MAG TPA: divalent-cation tolerance protein CutA [Longimicrobiaceae bacterium]|nr:divalent-cation tolerance protein CutA [Longimicrobiaceae bacterium]